MRKTKKMVAALLTVAAMLTGLTGCGASDSSEITIVSREDGSGTRGAFVELFGIEEKNADGEKVDKTTKDAEITNSTAVMLTTIQGNEAAIGYISLGAMSDKIKGLKIDGVEASVKTIKDGSYKIARPFNIATKDDLSALGKDFIRFILSKEGQAVVEEEGYIAIDTTTTYKKTDLTGKLVVGGSSSVSPVMQNLIEAYQEINTEVQIDLQQSDSSTGMSAAAEGTLDIGMASRELKDTELESGLKSTVIAMDGIVVITNKENKISDIKSETVKAIYTGKTTSWDDVK